MKKLFLFFLSFCSLVAVGQSSKLSPFTRSLILQKSISMQTDDALSKQFSLQKMNQIEYAEAFIHLTKRGVYSGLEELGVIIGVDFDDIVTARIPVDKLEAVSELSSVKFLEIGTPAYPQMDLSRVSTKSNLVQDGTATGLSQSYKGRNVVVGIVDMGFQYNHINFYTPDKLTLRVKRAWNQRSSGFPPAGFNYGTEYSTKGDLEYVKYDNNNTDDTGHGTHVAGIAGGSDVDHAYYGIATESDLVFVTYNNQSSNVSIAEGIKYIYDYATSVNKPAVVNLSLGSHVGPHDGTSTFDRTTGSMQKTGRILVGSAGNEGSTPLHTSKTFTAGTSTELKTGIYFIQPQQLYGTIDIWGDVNQDYSVSMAIIQTSTGNIVSQSATINAFSNSGIAFSPSAGASGNVSMTAGKNSVNNKGNVLLNINLQNITSGNHLVLFINSSQSGTVHAWADGNYVSFSSYGVAGYTHGDTQYTIGEIGGTGKHIITVGAYTTRGLSGVGQIASFSSRGPTPDGRMKPTVAAPGQTIISSLPNNPLVVSTQSMAQTVNYKGTNYYYGYMQGTSMSSPAVTGVIALWLEAHPHLDPNHILEILQETSVQDNYTGTVPNNTWGYGKIDAAAGVLKAVQIATSTGQVEHLPSAIMAYPNPNNGMFKLLFTRDDSDVSVTIYAMNGQMIYNQNISNVSAAEELDVNLGNSVANGAYIVKVKGSTSVQETFRLLISK